MKALELASKVSVASAIIGNLPEAPGYNGSILNIDDTEAGQIEKYLDEAAAELRRLAKVNAELLEVLERAQTTLRNYPAWEGQVDEIARNIAKAKEQQ